MRSFLGSNSIALSNIVIASLYFLSAFNVFSLLKYETDSFGFIEIILSKHKNASLNCFNFLMILLYYLKREDLYYLILLIYSNFQYFLHIFLKAKKAKLILKS